MGRIIRSLVVALLWPIFAVSAEEGGDALLGEADAASDWLFSGNLVYSSRPLSGSFVSTSSGGIVNNGMLATGESMNLGTSDTMMLALGVRYKHLGVIVNYMPTSYHGQGTALVGLGGPRRGWGHNRNAAGYENRCRYAARYSLLQLNPDLDFGVSEWAWGLAKQRSALI